MNLTEVQIDIDAKENVEWHVRRLYRLKNKVSTMIRECEAIMNLENEIAAAKRRRVYEKNRDAVILRTRIKEAILDAKDYAHFDSLVGDVFKITEEQYKKARSYTSLLDELEYLATLIKKKEDEI